MDEQQRHIDREAIHGQLSAKTVEVMAEIDNLASVTDFLHKGLSQRMSPMNIQNKVDICLEELFVNVASYAYGSNVGKAWVSYTLLSDPTGIRVEIADEGVPFDPLAKPDPERHETIEDTPIGGLGIFMTKTIADSIAYECCDGRNTTTFELYW